MTDEGPGLLLRLDVPADAGSAFDEFAEDLQSALSRAGIRLDPKVRGRIMQAGRDMGRVRAWDRGAAIRLEWTAAEWQHETATEVEVTFSPSGGGTRVSVVVPQWSARTAGLIPDILGWFAAVVAAPVLQATTPPALVDWTTDRRARKPSGGGARATYRDPTYHRPNFKLLLHTLALRRDDVLLEVGCGGGAFLQEALLSGCRAAALDHSPEMARLARESNRDAVGAGRLAVVEADAGRIPFAEGLFTCAVSTGVFGFIDDPIGVLSDIRRALAPGGRLALLAGTKQLKGTPAAPEPLASRIHFYEPAELEHAARAAGFAEVRVSQPDLEPYALEAGLTEEQVGFFRGVGGSLLLTARKS